MSIRGNPGAAEQQAHNVGVHIPTDQPAVPGGGDSKSVAMQAVIRAAQSVDADAAKTCNRSVDAIRLGLADAAARVTAADQQGAEAVEQSTYT
ncbi:MAG: hypothetical protein E6R04_10775 [Spirochaetes bacterium]|nr:MAG: hypothetical protein E6R04_10775 [Spirochaetota bacterium]